MIGKMVKLREDLKRHKEDKWRPQLLQFGGHKKSLRLKRTSKVPWNSVAYFDSNNFICKMICRFDCNKFPLCKSACPLGLDKRLSQNLTANCNGPKKIGEVVYIEQVILNYRSLTYTSMTRQWKCRYVFLSSDFCSAQTLPVERIWLPSLLGTFIKCKSIRFHWFEACKKYAVAFKVVSQKNCSVDHDHKHQCIIVENLLLNCTFSFHKIHFLSDWLIIGFPDRLHTVLRDSNLKKNYKISAISRVAHDQVRLNNLYSISKGGQIHKNDNQRSLTMVIHFVLNWQDEHAEW